MKLYPLLSLCYASLVSVSFSQSTTVAYFQDGSKVDTAALTNLVAPDAAYTVSALVATGFAAAEANITRNEFTTASTPTGPTAGSSAGSEWFFARSTTTTATPETGTDYTFY